MTETDKLNPDDPYRLGTQIAEGSRSRVYLAEDSSRAGQKVVVKFLREDLFPDNELAVNNMNHEAQCLSLAAHANVLAKIKTNVNEHGRPYLVTEYLQGQTLKKIISEGKLDENTFFDVFLPLTDALENMHKIGVLHLDLRPDKIIVDSLKKNPITKFIGFGRAKFLPWAGREQTVELPPKGDLYSLHYSSPEQINDKRCLPTSDVYSLSCVMYESLAGRQPYQGENELHVMAQHLGGKLQPLSEVRGDVNFKKFDECLAQALANETHRRFVDAAELRERISELKKETKGGWMSRLFKK